MANGPDRPTMTIGERAALSFLFTIDLPPMQQGTLPRPLDGLPHIRQYILIRVVTFFDS
jgi:hypothetical protein